MNILLVGHEGYLGRGLFEYLSTRHHVLGWDEKEDLFRLDASLLAREDIQILINLAVIDNRQSRTFQIDTPGDRVNVMGARHIARILQGSQIAWFQFSTREVLGPVYGPHDVVQTESGLRPKFLVDETFPYAPQNAYAKSKIIAEFLSESHPYTNVIRLTTGYTDYAGPGNNWVLALARTVALHQPVSLTRGGEQFRDPVHSADVGRLIEQVYEHQVFGERFHAGGGDESLISLKEFVRVADSHAVIQAAAGGDYGFAFDTSKALRMVGWKPTIQLRERIPVILDNMRRTPGLGGGTLS